MQNLKKLKGDASHRKFFRKQSNYGNSIVIQAKKDKFKNLLVYDAISKILNKNKVLAPKLYQENYKNNYIEVEDFGNKTIFQILKKNKNKKLLYFKDIIKLLNQIQSIKDKKIRKIVKNFQLECAYKPPKRYFGSVLDGRDITYNIVPDADFKFFITASVAFSLSSSEASRNVNTPALVNS